jgi:hypothetical protein
MLLSIVIILLVGFIAYFHYIQGFFSAGLSAIMTVVAALFALSTHETVVHGMLKGKFADQSYALILVALFAVYYSILRFIFDKLVPGNVRFPVIVDKVGAGVMGAIAGAFAAAILVIAGQTLPFTSSIATYERYPVEHDKQLIGGIQVPNRSSLQDVNYDQLDAEKFLDNKSTGLLLPVDDMLLGLISHVSSESGSLSDGKPFEQVHPDYLQELFGQRVGIQTSSRHAALPGSVDVTGIYVAGPGQYRILDPESFEQGPGHAFGVRPQAKDKPFKPPVLPTKGNVLLVVRAKFARENVDEKSHMLALTPSAVRIAMKNADGDYRNYFMVGESDDARILFAQQPDDYVFVPDGKGVDLVFQVPETALAKDKAGHYQIPEGTMLMEVKRMARVWLEGPVKSPVPVPAKDELDLVKKEGGPPGSAPITDNNGGRTENNSSSNPNAASSPLAFGGSPSISNALFTSISTQGNSGLDVWGTYEVRSGQFSSLEVEGGKSMELLSNGPNPVNQFLVPDGKRMVQLTGHPQGDPWAWANDPKKFALTDANGNKYPAQGFASKIKTTNGQNMLAIRYNANKPLDYSPPSSGDLKGSTPGDVILLFVVPVGTQLKSIDYNNAAISNVSLNVQ